nr:hypothetical protein [Kofleriaceae bacterium]
MPDDDPASRYRLAPVRAGRARDEAVSRGELADAVVDAAAAEAAIAAAAARVGVARSALDQALAADGSSALVCERRDRYAARRRRDLERADDEHARLVAAQRERLGEVDAARGRLASARARRELIERHFARWRDDRRKLADRRAD